MHETSAPVAAGPDEVLDAGLAALAQALWRQRGLLQRLSLRAKAAQLILAGDDHRWLDRAVDELESAGRAVRAADHEPARLLRAICRHLGMDPASTIRDVCERVDEPWDRALAEHAAALERLVLELASVSRDNRQLALGGLANVRALLTLTAGDRGGTGTYDDLGRARSEDRAHVDRLV